MEEIFNTQEYIDICHPYVLFIVHDNTNFAVKDTEYHQLTASMLSYQDGKIVITPEALTSEFEEFKNKHLGHKEYVDLPDLSFLKFDFMDIYKTGMWQFENNGVTESRICFCPEYLSYHASFREEHQKREMLHLEEKKKSHNLFPSSLNFGLRFIRMYSNQPDLLEEKQNMILSCFETESDDIKKQALKELRETQYYKINHIDEIRNPLSLHKIHFLHLLTTYLQGDMKKYKQLEVLYFSQTHYTSLNLSVSKELIQKQIELKINGCFQTHPFSISIYPRLENALQELLSKKIELSNDSNLRITLLRKFNELSKLNNAINVLSKTFNYQKKNYTFYKTIKKRNSVLATLINLGYDYLIKNKLEYFSPDILNNIFQSLKHYISLLTGDESDSTREKILSNINLTKNKFPTICNSEKFSINLVDKKNSLTIIDKIIHDTTQPVYSSCKYYTHNPSMILYHMKEAIKYYEDRFPLLITSFVTNKEITNFKLKELDLFCKNYNAKLFSENSSYILIVHDKLPYSQVDILSINWTLKADQQVNHILRPMKAQLLLEKMQQENFLPTYPIHSTAQLINEHLKKNTASTPIKQRRKKSLD